VQHLLHLIQKRAEDIEDLERETGIEPATFSLGS
jgi:hypothetical protein